VKIVLVDNGEYTAVYHDFYKNKVGVYKTSDGIEGLMELIGVRVTKNILCPDAKQGRLVDPTDGFPYHLDNLPPSEKTTVHKEKKKVDPVTPTPPQRKATKKNVEGEPQKAGRKARRPPKRK